MMVTMATPMRRVLLPLALALAAVLALAWWRALPGEDSITLEAARAEVEAGRAMLVDVREPQEHATGVAPGALLLPMRQLARRAAEIPRDEARPVLLICATQSRSRAVTQALREAGMTNVRYVHGGMSGWAARGWPLVPPGTPGAAPPT
jgi:rhodanese-related sulfurtransferase